MNQSLCSEYYDLFRKSIQDCFTKDHSEIVKRCVCGPYFILVQNGSTYVIEVDVESASSQCKNESFTFDPKPVFENFGQPEKKHVFSKNMEKWTGLFRRDGSATCYMNENERKDFQRDILPALVLQRQEQEKKENDLNRRILSSPEADKLKAFIADIDMFPILVLPKLSDHDKQTNIDHFRFLHYIHWCAVFDFDERSDIDGVRAMSAVSNMETEFQETTIFDFEDASIEGVSEKICFPRKAAWIFANGKSGERAFDRLDHEGWKDHYFTFVQTAVHAFYKNKEIIPATRRRALIFISDEVKDGIIELSDQLKTGFGLENQFFVFTKTHIRDHLEKELQLGEKLATRCVVMPWKHSHSVICECLNVKGRNREKFVCTSNGACVPLRVSQWQSWTDLEVLGVKECLEEWEGMSHDQKRKKALQEELKFYKGQSVSWYNYFCTDRGYGHVMKRTVMAQVIEEIKRIARNMDKQSDRVPIVPLVHFPGAGGTTLCRNILWELRNNYKCAIISRITDKTTDQVFQFWEAEEELQEGHVMRKELKPVIILADNLPTTQSSDHLILNVNHLNKQLFLEQIKHVLPRPVAVIIHCQRYEDPKDHDSPLLTQTLSPDEKDWIEKKNDELEQQKSEGIDVETLIAFLSLRHEFDKTKLKETVMRYVQHRSLEPNERKLVEYIALITSYISVSDGFQGLPVAGCDELMRAFYKKDYLVREFPWQKNLTRIAKILLVIETAYVSDRPTYIVRISHQQYARVILETILEQNDESLADLVVRCLNSELVTSRSNSVKEVHWILRNLLIRRHIENEETGDMTQLSLLMMDIYKKCSLERAADVFKEAFKTLHHAGYYQQLARLYILAKRYDDATEYGLTAVRLSPDIKEFKHTLGLVYMRKFGAITEKTSKWFTDINPAEKIKDLEIAFDALKNFVASQGREDDDIIHNCFTMGQTITTINDILQFLENILPKQELHKVGRYLTQVGFRYDLFDNHPGFSEMLKSLIDRGVKALQFLFYICYSYQSNAKIPEDTVRKYGTKRAVNFVKKHCLANFGTFARLLKHIHDPSWGNTTEVREDNAYRVENIKLRGTFFESILQNLQGGARKKRHERNIERLNDIKHNLEQISELSYTDMDNLMSVCLALELAEHETPFSQSYSKFSKICCQIIKAQKEADELCFLRAHLYRVLISWFNKDKPGFSVDEFRSSFQFKSDSLRLPARVHLFVTRADPSLKLCHWTDIYEHEDEYEDTRLTEIVTRKPEEESVLHVFRGTHKIRVTKRGWQYSYIDMEFRYQRTSIILTITKIRGITVTRECPVEFYLGFSLHGPVAYICNELSEMKE